VKNGDVQRHMDESKDAEEKLKAAVDDIEKHVRDIEKHLNLSHEDAHAVLLSILAYIKVVAAGGAQITSGALESMTCGAAMANICKLVSLGVPISQATALVAATTTAAEASAAGLEAGRVALDTSRTITGQVATLATKSLAVLGALVSVVDCVLSWATENPTKSGAKKCRDDLQDNVDKINHCRENWAPYVFHGEVVDDD